MCSHSVAVGTQSATAVPPTSLSVVDKATKLETIADLLQAIPTSLTSPDSMIKTTAHRLSAFTGKPADKLPIETLIDVGPEFSLYLTEHRYADNSIRTYRRYCNVMLKIARDHGWSPDRQPIDEAWRPILNALTKARGATTGVVRWASRQRITPREFSDADLSSWGDWMKRRSRKHLTVRKMKSRFRKAILDNGLESLLPKLNCQPHGADYKVDTSEMPEPLRTEVTSLIAWKTARYVKGRPKHGRLRPVSAAQLQAWIERLFGFASKVAGRSDVNCLAILVSDDVVSAFVEWALNVRNLTRCSLIKLSSIYAAMRHHPAYKTIDWQWFSDILTSLPEDSESDRLARKALKMVPYDVVSSVPDAIVAGRSKRSQRREQEAWFAHDALLIRWLTVLPWRQRNLRECRIGKSETDNLFFEELPTGQHIARASWVEQSLEKDPNARFWQFFFREPETKTGQSVRAVLPQCLVQPLEQYLNDHRANLVASGDPGTLFLNRAGGPLTAQQMTELVSQITLRQVGRRVTPHLFRSIFAYRWLEDFPEDYLTLSKVLWHRDIKTTLRIYGGNFNESNGVRRVDDWLSSRSTSRRS